MDKEEHREQEHELDICCQYQKIGSLNFKFRKFGLLLKIESPQLNK